MNARDLPRVCLVEDDAIMGESLCDRFRLEGFAVDWLRDAESARRAVENRRYAAVISDILLPDRSGEQLFRDLLALGGPLPPFVFITGYGTIDGAVTLLKLGAADYVTKPFDLEELIGKIRQLSVARSAPAKQGVPTLGVSPAMQRIEETLRRIAKQVTNVLITGESGAGKEWVAKALNELARDDDKNCPFVAVNCAAIPESLMEAELFGHERGAFTGASRSRKGVFEQAHCGTLFLDEIGEMSPAMQAKLLRAIQDRRITRVGAEAPIPVELRLFCATNRDLRDLVRQGAFREDLYYRINVIHLRVPPLRERKEDILWLARRVLEEYAAAHPGTRPSFTPDAERALLVYPWPGNIRELHHAIERACIMTNGGVLTREALFEDLPDAPPAEALPSTLAQYLEACERRYIAQALETSRGQIGTTAAMLRISRKNLWEKMRKLGISGASKDGGAPEG